MTSRTTSSEESPGYLSDGQAPIYFVHHHARGLPKGTVLLCSPLGLESTHAALVWRRLARALAAHGWDCVRFDWRGTGESADSFTKMTFASWKDDLLRMLRGLSAANAVAVSSHAESRPSAEASDGLAPPQAGPDPARPNAGDPGPLVLLGLRAGALLAAHVFVEGFGDGLILWEAPPSGEAHLMDILRRKLAADYALGEGARKTRDDYLAELRAGKRLDVDGFPWNVALWDSFRDVTLPAFEPGRSPCSIHSRTHRISRPPFWQDTGNLTPDVSAWFDATLAYLDGVSSATQTARRSLPRSVEARFDGLRRRLLVMPFHAKRLVATQHVANSPCSVALLLGNFGYVPRSGQAGMAAAICDAAAMAGVGGFRVDLPCLGDAEGELPTETAEWVTGVRGGSLTEPTLFVIDRLQAWFGIEKFVLGGLCAASITALYAHEQDRRGIAGLLLLEPEFFTIEGPESVPSPRSNGDVVGPRRWGERARKVARRLTSSWGWMRMLAGENPMGWRLPIPRVWLRRALWLQRDRLPSRANMPLVAAWQAAVQARVPMLIVTAEGKIREVFFDRVNLVAVPHYAQYVAERRHIQHVRLAGTNHTFTTGGAIEKVTHLVRDWVNTQFASA